MGQCSFIFTLCYVILYPPVTLCLTRKPDSRGGHLNIPFVTEHFPVAFEFPVFRDLLPFNHRGTAEVHIDVGLIRPYSQSVRWGQDSV